MSLVFTPCRYTFGKEYMYPVVTYIICISYDTFTMHESQGTQLEQNSDVT